MMTNHRIVIPVSRRIFYKVFTGLGRAEDWI